MSKHTFLPVLLALAGALACGDAPLSTPPPEDRFYFPTGLTLRHVPAGCLGGAPGCQTQLLVASSNFDLRYDAANGGSLLAVDVEATLAGAGSNATSPLSPVVLGGTRIGSFAGEIALADPTTCPGWSGPAQALVASRSQNTLYKVTLGDDGALTCGAGCALPLAGSLADPYGVTVACGNFPVAQGEPPTPRQLAFVTYLRTPGGEGWLSQLDLADPGAPRRELDFQISPTHSTVFDPVTTRLFVTSRFAGVGFSPLRWIELATPDRLPTTVNLFDVVRGAELRGLALSTDRTRAYAALRIYDVDLATSIGGRPSNDLAGALAVLDLTPLPGGPPSARVLRVVPLDKGATEVRVIPRPPAAAGAEQPRDLVAVTSGDDATVTIYDDQAGAIVKVFATCGVGPAGASGAPTPCDPGNPLLGRQPFGLAVEPRANGLQRLYVGSFDRSWVNVIDLDPARPESAPVLRADGAPAWWRIGAERP